MPVSGEFTWSETNSDIELCIPLKGVSPKKVDIFTASTILKVAYSPFLIDLNLYAEIQTEMSRAIMKDGTLKILLVKKEGQHKLWGQLTFEGTKEEMKERRQKALNEREDNVKRQMEKVATKKVEEERRMFRRHMDIERKEQQRMDDVKANEKKTAEEAMHQTFSEIQQSSSTQAATSVHQKDSHDSEELPPPRAAVHSTFRHTPRFFKTPLRESTMKQEQEFIMKNRSNLRKNKLLNVDDIEDVDPLWLKSKGDAFKSKGDYSSAINAYSDALEADGDLIDVLSARAACYLQLRNGSCCIKDSVDVLEKTACRSNMCSQLEKETRVRLGMAYCLNLEYALAMEQFEKAQELDETDKLIEQCIHYLKVLIDASALKEKADALFAEGNFSEAMDTYTKALEVDPLLISALINRAGCHLALIDSKNCIKDSTNALELLSQGRQILRSNTLALLLYPDSKTKRKWMVTLLCRRSAASKLEKDLLASLKDLEQALQYAKQDFDIHTNGIQKEIEVLRQDLNN